MPQQQPGLKRKECIILKNYAYVLAIDPSGSYYEGKGITGWCIYNCLDQAVTISDIITARSHASMAQYWDAHIQLIERFNNKYKGRMIVVIEDYILYADKANDQINSHMETSKLIGVLQHHCFMKDIPYMMQLASEVKARWRDNILHHYGYIAVHGRFYVLPSSEKTRLIEHQRDAIRHAVHFANFKNGRPKYDESTTKNLARRN
jgi:hypothetical protein